MVSWSDRRQEPRTPRDGPVTLRAYPPLARTIPATLVDESNSGLRIRHQDKMLETGETVDFETMLRSGRARVMWTRFGGPDLFEAGLYILPA